MVQLKNKILKSWHDNVYLILKLELRRVKLKLKLSKELNNYLAFYLI